MNATEFGSLITKLKESGADYVVALGDTPVLIALRKQMDAAGYKPKVMDFARGAQLQQFSDALGPLADGIVIDSYWTPETGYPGAAELGARFDKEADFSIGQMVGPSYATGQILMDAITTAELDRAAEDRRRHRGDRRRVRLRSDQVRRQPHRDAAVAAHAVAEWQVRDHLAEDMATGGSHLPAALIADERNGDIEIRGSATMPTANDLLNAVLTGLGIGGLFAVIALGLSLVFGVMRLMNLAHGEFIVLGAYIVFYLGTSAGLDPLVATLIAAPVVALIAYPLQHYALSPVMSRGAEAPLLITFGVSVDPAEPLHRRVLRRRALAERGLRVGERQRPRRHDAGHLHHLPGRSRIVLLGATHLVLTRTGFGRRLRASSEDAVAAEVMGVNVKRVYSMTYALAAGSAALGGCLIGLTFSFAPTTGTAYLVTGFAVVVLGGVGSVKGTLLGGLMLGVIESIGATFVGDGWRVFIGCILVLIVLSVRPQGLFGSARGA